MCIRDSLCIDRCQYIVNDVLQVVFDIAYVFGINLAVEFLTVYSDLSSFGEWKFVDGLHEVRMVIILNYQPYSTLFEIYIKVIANIIFYITRPCKNLCVIAKFSRNCQFSAFFIFGFEKIFFLLLVFYIASKESMNPIV